MPKAKASSLSNLDQQIYAITQDIRARYTALKQELDGLSDTYHRLTNKVLTSGTANGGTKGKASPNATAVPKTSKKRIRLPGVDAAWITTHLTKKPATLKQLQDLAAKEGKSGLSVMNVLRDSKTKFKATAGEKVEGKKGKAPQVWGVK
jgi:hypothetical protein